MEKAKVAVNTSERAVLEEASRGTTFPTKKTVDEFKSLLSKKLIESKGNNRYTATKLGIYVLTDTVSSNGNGNGHEPHESAKAVKESTATGKRKAGSKPKPDFMKPKASLEELDARYSKKYPWYVKGSVKEAKNGTKRVAQIKCQTKGCKETRQVFTSDIFQVKNCTDCRDKKKAA